MAVFWYGNSLQDNTNVGLLEISFSPSSNHLHAWLLTWGVTVQVTAAALLALVLVQKGLAQNVYCVLPGYLCIIFSHLLTQFWCGWDLFNNNWPRFTVWRIPSAVRCGSIGRAIKRLSSLGSHRLQVSYWPWRSKLPRYFIWTPLYWFVMYTDNIYMLWSDSVVYLSFRFFQVVFSPLVFAEHS